MSPPMRPIKADEPANAPVVKRQQPRLPKWQWGCEEFDAHVKDFRLWQAQQGNRCKSYIRARAGELGFSYEHLISDDRHRPVTFARQTVMWEIKTQVKPSISWPELARLFGGRDHTTALHAVRKISQMKARGEI